MSDGAITTVGIFVMWAAISVFLYLIIRDEFKD